MSTIAAVTWIDHVQVWSPYAILTIGLLVAWWRNKIKAHRETELRLSVTNKWLREIKKGVVEHKQKLIDYHKDAVDMETKGPKYTITSFPIDELKEIDFEKNFRSLVKNIELEKGKVPVEVFYQYRKVLRLLERHLVVVERIHTYFTENIQLRRENLRTEWEDFKKYFYQKVEEIGETFTERPIYLKLLEIDSVIVKDVRENFDGQWTRRHGAKLAEKVKETLNNLDRVGRYNEFHLRTQYLLSRYKELKSLHESTGRSLKNMDSQLDSLSDDIDVLIKTYEKAKVKHWTKIETS